MPTQESPLAQGIPRYTVVTRDVAVGAQPTLDGLRWLKERGYRAVLNLLPETDADPAESSMVRELGLEYIPLPVAPETINPQTVAQFNQIVDSAERPL
ncbi:MAG: hypothetical protein HY000_11430, partial [Planctomycetes bacterium]|nr:hypothetical protein [Planctomycetota bacterium]